MKKEMKKLLKNKSIDLLDLVENRFGVYVPYHEKSSLFIGNDSGLMYLTQHTPPTVGLFVHDFIKYQPLV